MIMMIIMIMIKLVSLPVTDEILLVEKAAVGAEEGKLDEGAFKASSTDVENLRHQFHPFLTSSNTTLHVILLS